MKAVVFTLDAIFALGIAVASISILIYFNYYASTPFTILYSNAQSTLSNLLSTSVDSMQNSSVLAKAMSNQFAGANATWPQFGGGIYRNNSNDFGPIKPIISSVFTAGAAITTGVVADYGNIYFAAGSSVYAVNATTNNVVWTNTQASSVASTPALYAGEIVLANSANLVALNAQTGATVWSVALPSAATSPLLAYDNRIVLGAANGHVYSFFSGNGTVAWTTNVVGTSPFNVIVAEGSLAAKPSGSQVFLLMQTGASANQLWATAQAAAPTNLASQGQFIYFGVGSAVNAIYVNGTGSFLAAAGAAVKGIGVYKNYVIYQTASSVNALSASGSNVWGTAAPTYFGAALTNALPAISGRMVYTLWANGLAGMDLSNGTIEWFSSIPSSAAGPYMALAYGRLYVVAGTKVIAYGACTAPIHASVLSAIATLDANSDPGCAAALSMAAFPSANYTVYIGNASAHNAMVANFNGATSYVNVQNNTNWYNNTMSVSAWFQIYDWGARTVISTYKSSNGWMFYRNAGTTNGVLDFLTYYTNTIGGQTYLIPGASNLQLNTWYNVVLVRKASGATANATIYINGVKAVSSTTATFNGFYQDVTQPLEIGRAPSGGWYFNGMIANVQLYNTSLSPNQAQSLYQRGISGLPLGSAGLVGWWPLAGDTNDYANFASGYNTGVTFTYQNFTAPSLANAYSIGGSSVMLPVRNYSSGAENVIKVGVYAWK